MKYVALIAKTGNGYLAHLPALPELLDELKSGVGGVGT